MFNAKSVSLLVLSALLLTAGAARADSLDVRAGDVRVTVDSSGDVTVRSSSSSVNQSNDQSDEHSSGDDREPLYRSPNADSGSNTTQSCSQQSYSYSSQSDSNSTNRTYSTSRCD